MAELRARDGPLCWLCARPFAPAATRLGRRPSLEHLVPRRHGGGDGLDNLVLCHVGCNRHLGDRPLEKKLRMRERWRRAAARRGA